jgi:transcriptional regulatory protein LevR/transcriptional regulator with AAA-type ATPase domain
LEFYGGIVVRIKDEILYIVNETKGNTGISALQISRILHMDRANVSRYLNKLVLENKLKKIQGRPVLYKKIEDEDEILVDTEVSSIDKLIGSKHSLHLCIQQAKAAMFYPPRGLHTLILGETGVGKSMFAEMMFKFSVEAKLIPSGAPFIIFNCADYSDNPQLLVAHIFGVKKGAYTGADKDKDGLLKRAHGGIIFLDEIHRLPPQGQELLFTFIDKGYFRPLGDTEEFLKASVQIIAATTEDPNSHLLKTFTRRIPMMITLPSLDLRGMKERYGLIELFIKEESRRVNKSIYFNRDSLISFLLYDCIGNIGQLKSDIQLSCAKAFLNFKTEKKNYIIVTQSDIPKEVKKGMLKLQSTREEVNKVLKNSAEILNFYYDDKANNINIEEYSQDNGDFYDFIEGRIQTLKNSGLNDNEINEIVNIDVEDQFKKYLATIEEDFKKEEITKFVGEDIVNLVDEILEIAKQRLQRQFNENLYFALALHLNGSIRRIKNGSKIYNPKLNSIRINYSQEFFTAMEIAKIIDDRFNIMTPLDEIGYITMFLLPTSYELNNSLEEKVGVVLMLHGSTTASSMAEVANSLVGVSHVVPLDMPLTMPAEKMYKVAKEKIQCISKGKGILMLVDMGSLVNFGHMIYEETGIIVKTIEMVSTPIVIEACRKAITGRTLDEIYRSCKEITLSKRSEEKKSYVKRKKVIITACFTGEGAAEKLKDILEEKMQLEEIVEIVPLNILNRAEFLSKISYYKENHKILAIVGTVDVHLDDIPFFSALDILSEEKVIALQHIVITESTYSKVALSLKDHMKIKDCFQLVEDVRADIEEIKLALRKSLSEDVQLGIALHISFMVDRLIRGERELEFQNLQKYIDQFSREIEVIKNCLKNMEENYKIKIGYNELAYICKMFMYN